MISQIPPRQDTHISMAPAMPPGSPDIALITFILEELMEHTDHISNLRSAILSMQKPIDFLNAVCKGVSWYNLMAKFM
jgi:hypothetical protein